MQTKKIELKENLKCFHCGDECKDNSIRINDKLFCCLGCKSVYEILNNSDLCEYYNYNSSPGVGRKELPKRDYTYLDNPDIKEKIIDFSNDKYTSITLFIPTMHCSSCIWILENLYKLNPGIIFSRVDFLKKKLELKFMNVDTTLKEVIILLDSIGYEPVITGDRDDSERLTSESKKLYYRLGIAGFAFGNIMLLSFPEYLGISEGSSLSFNLFGYLNILLALPVLFYSASDYFISAFKGLRKKIVNIDVPIALGISVLFMRSIFEILSGTGAGFFDSMTGLVFFLLTGRLFQNKTYESLNFERDYKSYFPLAVNIIKEVQLLATSIDKIVVGDKMNIRHNEIIPADSILMRGDGLIDYSFVTGEAEAVSLKVGDKIYAGGKQVGGAIDAEVIKEVSNSYLTQLWNNKTFKKDSVNLIQEITNRISKYFTFAVVSIAVISFFYWFGNSTAIAFNTFTAVLIVACPCALALSAPFTLGNTLRIFGRNRLYLKNSNVIEDLSKTKKIVFDKTGTITQIGSEEVKYTGTELSEEEINILLSVTSNSTHPKSLSIHRLYKADRKFDITEDYDEIPGQGVKGRLGSKTLLLGSATFIDNYLGSNIILDNIKSSTVLMINDSVKGYFSFSNKYRDGLYDLVERLRRKYRLSVLSGDNESERTELKNLFPSKNQMLFNQSPLDKLDHIESLKAEGEHVLMLGDGLNDAGALKSGNVGIAITENANNFTPASDGILDSKSFVLLDKFLDFSRTSIKVIKINFAISFLYNIVGLSFAVSGNLSPIIAAILMPLSSISVVIFSMVSTNFLSKRIGL
ncbi:MAG: heavy metal translocating P-type ATPase metal-binding domain-containing protein [Bacteroidetes bacterium]|nr:heavy metal translocating P-type ATPase metal-binding domain-containing protein [Bacteroidota bacterium]